MTQSQLKTPPPSLETGFTLYRLSSHLALVLCGLCCVLFLTVVFWARFEQRQLETRHKDELYQERALVFMGMRGVLEAGLASLHAEPSVLDYQKPLWQTLRERLPEAQEGYLQQRQGAAIAASLRSLEEAQLGPLIVLSAEGKVVARQAAFDDGLWRGIDANSEAIFQADIADASYRLLWLAPDYLPPPPLFEGRILYGSLILIALLSFIVAVWWVRVNIVLPLSYVRLGMERIAEGEEGLRIPSTGSHEIRQLKKRFNLMSFQLAKRHALSAPALSAESPFRDFANALQAMRHYLEFHEQRGQERHRQEMLQALNDIQKLGQAGEPLQEAEAQSEKTPEFVGQTMLALCQAFCQHYGLQLSHHVELFEVSSKAQKSLLDLLNILLSYSQEKLQSKKLIVEYRQKALESKLLFCADGNYLSQGELTIFEQDMQQALGPGLKSASLQCFSQEGTGLMFALSLPKENLD